MKRAPEILQRKHTGWDRWRLLNNSGAGLGRAYHSPWALPTASPATEPSQGPWHGAPLWTPMFREKPPWLIPTAPLEIRLRHSARGLGGPHNAHRLCCLLSFSRDQLAPLGLCQRCEPCLSLPLTGAPLLCAGCEGPRPLLCSWALSGFQPWLPGSGGGAAGVPQPASGQGGSPCYLSHGNFTSPACWPHDSRSQVTSLILQRGKGADRRLGWETGCRTGERSRDEEWGCGARVTVRSCPASLFPSA